MARLVAETHVEQKLVIRAAVENELLSPEDETRCLAMEIADDLRELSDHALSAEEYIQKIGVEEAKWAGKRNTTIPIRSLRLPVPYIDAVLEAFKDGKISRGKAAELLMVDEQAFDERFGEVAEACED
ncbi:MAG: hypothetical protein ACREI2_07130 [Nitrospiraceae bacterium]